VNFGHNHHEHHNELEAWSSTVLGTCTNGPYLWNSEDVAAWIRKPGPLWMSLCWYGLGNYAQLTALRLYLYGSYDYTAATNYTISHSLKLCLKLSVYNILCYQCVSNLWQLCLLEGWASLLGTSTDEPVSNWMQTVDKQGAYFTMVLIHMVADNLWFWAQEIV